MQRKNNLLSRVCSRCAFVLVWAIGFLVLIATVGMLSLNFSATSSNQTSIMYIKEQAKILMRSATEATIMAISVHDYASSCLNRVSVYYPNESDWKLQATMDIIYIGKDVDLIGNGVPNKECKAKIKTSDSNNTAYKIKKVIIDTTVISNEESEELQGFNQLRLFRRTMQSM